MKRTSCVQSAAVKGKRFQFERIASNDWMYRLKDAATDCWIGEEEERKRLEGLYQRGRKCDSRHQMIDHDEVFAG